MKLNNVDLNKIYNTEKEIYDNLSLTNRKVVVDGHWNFENNSEQFEANLKYPKGNTVIKTDNSSFLGGNDSKPEPVQYFILGIAASYASSFVNSASIRGILLKNLSVKVEANLNYSYFFSISDDPKIEEINITLEVESNAEQNKLIELKESALKCCPALSALNSDLKVNVNLIIKERISIINSDSFIIFN